MTPPTDRLTNLRARAEAMRAVRRFFESRDYLEVETPLRVPSPGLDLHLDAFAIEEPHGAPPRFLITSPEYQMKRLLSEGMSKIFQICRCFRRGEVGPRHNPEFTMLEWYRAPCAFEALIEETESLIVDVAIALRGSATLHVRDAFAGVDRVVTLDPPFERLPIARAFARHSSLSEAEALALALSGRADDEARFYRVLVEEVEPALALGPPVVLVDYPVTQASLARKKPGDPRLAERFELFVGGVELCNGFGELVDAREQRARFEADQRARAVAGKPVYPIDERFLDAMERGLPECAGNALGLDRLILLAVGAASLDEVCAFTESSL
jgi:lysyl-tRNA synthetase class 2